MNVNCCACSFLSQGFSRNVHLYVCDFFNEPSCAHFFASLWFVPELAMARTSTDAARDAMIGEIEGGAAAAANAEVDVSKKALLVRGCDPVMASRASKMLPPLLGNPIFDTATDDDTFIRKLKARKWDVVMFAPGACRHDAAKRAIPGGNADTRGWTLTQYRALVREHQSDKVPIVETTEERKIVPKLREALDL